MTVDLGVDDHFELERTCAELGTDQGSPEHRKEVVDRLVDRFAQHLPLVPAPVAQVMRDLKRAGPADPAFERLLSTFLRAIRRHVRGTGKNTE